MSPDRQPTVDGDNRGVAEISTGAPDRPPQGPSGVLVGRAGELATITAAMAAARRGAARVLHLVGEAGIGKTSLAEHAAALAAG